jgi:transcriptional regulator with XRE-family HTH domain
VDTRVQLGKQLRTLRTKWGYTQQDVSDLLQIDRSTYAYYETNRTTPPLSTLKKLARIYRVSISDLLGSEDTPPQVADSGQNFFTDFDHNLSHIYDLKRDERQLLSLYRLADKKIKEKVILLLRTTAEK